MSYNRGAGFGYVGFQMPKRSSGSAGSGSMSAVPPPASTAATNTSGRSRHGYSTMNAIAQTALTAAWSNVGRKRAKTEDEYFEEEEDNNIPSLAYIPAPGSPSREDWENKERKRERSRERGGRGGDAGRREEEEEDDDDPLDAFMAGLEEQQEKEKKKEKDKQRDKDKDKAQNRGTRGDIEDEDDEESYYKYIEENPIGTQDDDSDVEIEYDEDGNPIPPPKKKFIDPLPPIDHSQIEYQQFAKNFYTPHEDIEKLTNDEVEDLKTKLGIKILGASPPRPVSSFAHFGLDEGLMKTIRKSEYSQPTPIQAAAVPAALSGRDVIGIARTGSGKTAAFVWPAIVHLMDQQELKSGDGPIVLIMAPTRELAQQIYTEFKRFAKVYNIGCVCAYGGGNKWEQCKALEEGAEVVVGTPGRLIDLVKAGSLHLERVTLLVLDEADRMLALGFEPQVRSICNHVRPGRQVSLWSATWPKRVERLARDATRDPVRVLHGEAGDVSADVHQIVKIFKTQTEKWKWLLSSLVEFTSAGSVLIFVTRKVEAEQVAGDLGVAEHDALLLHGDMEQADRNRIITAFRRQQVNILVATDVAARGLDITHIRTVINFTVARDADTHTHRVGRTGRAGQQGTAYSLLLPTDKDFAGHIIRGLEAHNQDVPQEVMDMAMSSAWFRKSRFASGRGKQASVGGRGLGYSGPCDDPKRSQPSPRQTGPAASRITTIREAFRLQYNQFQASSDHSWEQTLTTPGIQMPLAMQQEEEEDEEEEAVFAVPLPPGALAPPPPPANPRRKGGKRSRWE